MSKIIIYDNQPPKGIEEWLQKRIDEQVRLLGQETLVVRETANPKDVWQDRKRAIAYCNDGDTFVVAKLEYLARSLRDLAQVVEELTKRGAQLRVLSFFGGQFDSHDLQSVGLSNLIWGMAEFDSDKARSRNAIAVEEAKKSGDSGRPPIEKRIKKKVSEDYHNGFTGEQIAQRNGIGRSTVFKILKEHRMK